MKKNDQPAFPMGYHRDGNSADHQGMSLRDWFAGQVIQGLLVSADDWTTEGIAELAYDVADAMLKERLQWE